eukprot:scaffold17413_cov72-Phaeocystis_antarctica.AAC.12
MHMPTRLPILFWRHAEVYCRGGPLPLHLLRARGLEVRVRRAPGLGVRAHRVEARRVVHVTHGGAELGDDVPQQLLQLDALRGQGVHLLPRAAAAHEPQ